MVPFIFAFFCVVAVWLGVRAWRRRAKRLALLQSPLSEEQWAIILDHVPLIKQLPPALSAQFAGKVNLFCDQVDFLGGGGLEITEKMELSIAAQACLLIVNSDAWYKTLRTVIIYPSAFKSKQASHEGYVVHERREVRLGESWTHGPVILSWAHAKQGAANAIDGQNVVLHEFAHQLDGLSGTTNAVPILRKGQRFAVWEKVILQAYDAHVKDVERGRKTVMDAYGAQNHEEFFAVAIEVFFEKPEKFQNDMPQVYAQLSELLGIDPISWNN